jgi:hypothetical protein
MIIMMMAIKTVTRNNWIEHILWILFLNSEDVPQNIAVRGNMVSCKWKAVYWYKYTCNIRTCSRYASPLAVSTTRDSPWNPCRDNELQPWSWGFGGRASGEGDLLVKKKVRGNCSSCGWPLPVTWWARRAQWLRAVKLPEMRFVERDSEPRLGKMLVLRSNIVYRITNPLLGSEFSLLKNGCN